MHRENFFKRKMLSSSTAAGAVDEVGPTEISSIHSDILLTHILSRLDGPTLAATSCVSSQLHTLVSTEEKLWEQICHNTWPSINDPRLRHIISTFQNGPRSFVSDSFSLINSDSNFDSFPSFIPPPEVISAVDLRYKNEIIFSKVHVTKTETTWFRSSPFRIDLLDPKDVVPTPICNGSNICEDLEENLIVSWIVIDPIRKRAGNVSSWRPVSVQRHWLSGEIQVRFATILTGHQEIESEFVQCGIMVAFGGEGEMQVREVSLKVEDMDGINLSGKDSLGILMSGMGKEKRRKGWRRRREEGKERYEEYVRMKGERKDMKLRREGRMDSICVALGVSIFSAFWMVVFFH